MGKKPKPTLSPLERAIAMKRLVIKRWDERIAEVRRRADDEIAECRRKQATARVLLAALERGALKP